MAVVTAAKTVMILGGGVMQLPAVRLAKAKGWRVIVAARDISPEITALADYTEAVDLRDAQAMLAAARRYREEIGLDGVFTAGTDFSITVAQVASHCGLPGIPPEVARAASDKERMRDCFRRHGVPSPRFFTVAAGEAVPRHDLPFPLVVKPVDNMGARGVRRVDNPAELERALEQALTYSRAHRVIVEEYLDGPELSLDAIVYRGKVSICGVADRHICFPPFFVEMGHTMPTGLEPASRLEAEKVFRQGIRALGIENGAAKGDIKLSGRGCYVGEIAARLSGGYMSGWTFPYATGLEVTAAALNIAVGLPPGPVVHDYAEVSAERAFISIPGIVRRVEGLDRARSLPGLEALFLRTARGQEVRFPIDNMGKCGNVISRAPTRERAVGLAEQAVQSILVRLKPGCPQTNAHLFTREQGDTSPPALVLSDGMNRRALAEMPAFLNTAAAKDPGRGVAVLDLPGRERESGLDWHGLPFQEALRRSLELTGFSLQDENRGSKLLLGAIFWQAFLRGSIQGAVYLRDMLKNGELELLRRLAT
jgi:biotin carboxylase